MPAGNKAEISLTDAHSWVTSSGIIYADLASFSISFNHFNHHSKTQSMHIAAMMKSELLVMLFFMQLCNVWMLQKLPSQLLWYLIRKAFYMLNKNSWHLSCCSYYCLLFIVSKLLMPYFMKKMFRTCSKLKQIFIEM